jgi:hypothetical protein
LGRGQGGEVGAAETFAIARHDQMAAGRLRGGGSDEVFEVGSRASKSLLQNVAVDRGDSEQFQQSAQPGARFTSGS